MGWQSCPRAGTLDIPSPTTRQRQKSPPQPLAQHVCRDPKSRRSAAMGAQVSQFPRDTCDVHPQARRQRIKFRWDLRPDFSDGRLPSPLGPTAVASSSGPVQLSDLSALDFSGGPCRKPSFCQLAIPQRRRLDTSWSWTGNCSPEDLGISRLQSRNHRSNLWRPGSAGRFCVTSHMTWLPTSTVIALINRNKKRYEAYIFSPPRRRAPLPKSGPAPKSRCSTFPNEPLEANVLPRRPAPRSAPSCGSWSGQKRIRIVRPPRPGRSKQDWLS